MATNKATKYAQNVTSQSNPNASKQRVKWTNVANIVGHTTNYATSQYTLTSQPSHYTTKVTYDKNGKKITKKVADKYTLVYNRPWTLASSDFHFEIPSNAHVYSVKFQVSMKADKNVDVYAPIGNFRISTSLYPKKYDDTPKGVSTGWNDGCYMVVPKSKKLTSKYQTYTYTMDEAEIKKAKHKTSYYNANIMGIDLIWQDANKFTKAPANGKSVSADVKVQWIKCIIEYDVPTYDLTITSPTKAKGTESEPLSVNAYKNFKLVVNCKNNTQAKGGNQTVNIGVPWGTSIVSASPSEGTYSNGAWSVPAKVGANANLTLTLKSKKGGLSNITASSLTKSAKYYYNTLNSEGFDGITIYANGEFHKRSKCCASIVLHGISSDTSLQVNVANSGNITSQTFSLDQSGTTAGVTLDSQTTTSATLTVPQNEEFDVTLNYCFYPTAVGNLTFTVSSSDSDVTETQTFVVEDSYDFVLKPLADSIKVSTHRVVSDVDTDATIIPCVADEGDANMVMSECRINMTTMEELDYIGCIPLEQTHFNPKSTFKDTLLNQSYKNKKYMGKKLATDEDITLNVRLHPHQVTTLQGLIEMDKPIPINANHKCFEGDALNHRGWCEIYGVKTEQTGNNPHWYKCDIDVKYLTHNLNTRFNIEKGAKVSDYEIPSLMSETHSSGENLSDEDSYFVADTDGTFYYAEDYIEDGEWVTFNDNERNSFNIDNGQHIRVTTRNPLTHTSSVAFTWSSVLLDEDRENAVSRIVRLMDKDSKLTVFEYQYDGLEIDEDDITSNIIYRVLQNGEMMDGNSGRDIQFRYSATEVTYEDDTVETETDDNVEDDIESGEAHFGSTIKLTINKGILSIVDEGFNGREIVIEDIKLEDGEYYYQVEWVNNNEDEESADIDCVFDFVVQDTILTSAYADKFGKLIVSPFPVTDKKILFTRDAEEGIIYYYSDDQDEFSYLIDPYYQYMNGTDLVTSDGISIFNLNYGYDVIYIQNGLVRLGFNRLTGYLYLGKFDSISQEYITTHTFHLEKFDDVNVNSISDDKIELQASDCVFTIYRGHPYIKVKHELEDIIIDTVFNRVWAEQVGDDDSTELPVYWDLLNEKNLLDPCVGGSTTLKSSCVETSQVEHNDRTAVSIAWSSFPTDIEVGDVKFTLSMDNLSEYKDEVTLDGTQCSFGSYSWEIESDGKAVAIDQMMSADSTVVLGQTTKVYARLVDSDGKGVSGKTINFYKE